MEPPSWRNGLVVLRIRVVTQQGKGMAESTSSAVRYNPCEYPNARFVSGQNTETVAVPKSRPK
jgi:hypothetical protein